MTVGDDTLIFVYDASGSPMAVVCNGTVYYYITNLQGDVVAIIDNTKTIVVQYTYDAWGKLLSTVDESNVNLGLYNPLRYRGYVYDSETQLYYLQSRYYDPALGRFINADAFAATGQGILGNNMFAYCNNTPVLFTDSTGHAFKLAPLMDDISAPVPYITDQDDPEVADNRFGLANISHSGCGIVASYNTLMSMGYTASFDEVLDYYNSHIGGVIGLGLTGLLPYNIKQFFTSLGFSVITTNQKEQIDALSKIADGCIMYYAFPQTYHPLGIPFYAYGAHFVEYSKTDSGYIGRNTSEGDGTYAFTSPSDYGHKGDRYYAVGIFIFE